MEGPHSGDHEYDARAKGYSDFEYILTDLYRLSKII
jgi:hypothetical protein